MVEVYRRRNSPFWYYDITIGSQRLRRSTGCTRKRDAVAAARDAVKKAATSLHVPDTLVAPPMLVDTMALPDITLREALYDHYLPGKVSASSYKALKLYAEYLCGDRKGVGGLGGDTTLANLTTTMLRSYRNRRLAQGMSQQSIDHEIKVVSAAYNLVKEDFRVRAGLKFPMARVKGKPRFLTVQEETALLVELDPSNPVKVRGGSFRTIDRNSRLYIQRVDNYDLVVMLLDTGCRSGEIVQLSWAMVDTLEWKWIHIYREKVDNEGKLATTARVREVLQRRWQDKKESPYVFAGWSPEDNDAPRMNNAAIRRAMERIGLNSPSNVARFGRRGIRSLRDTFATKLRGQGVSLDRLQMLLGHASPQMTQKYAYLAVDSASEDAAAILDELANKEEKYR